MTTIISITDLLNRIRLARKNLDDVYKNYLDPESEEAKHQRLLVSLYNPTRKVTVNGAPVEDTVKDITRQSDRILGAFYKLEKLLMIKEQVNAQSKITIPSLTKLGENETITIAQALVLKSPSMRNFYLNYINKLSDDFSKAEHALDNHLSTTMSHENVERYVIAKMNSLNISTEKIMSDANYSAFAKEYSEANELRILDPLKISNISELKSRVENFYNTIDTKLAEFNASTKIWIDLDKPENLWGFVEKVNINLPGPDEEKQCNTQT